jgi:hypothetical protein
MSLDGFMKINGGNRIGECEEMLVGMLAAIKPLLHEVVLVLEHFFDSAFADVAAVFLFAVDGIREILVICTDCFCNGSRGSPCAEEVTNNFLACANFGKGAVEVLIQVNPERLLLSGEYDAV